MGSCCAKGSCDSSFMAGSNMSQLLNYTVDHSLNRGSTLHDISEMEEESLFSLSNTLDETMDWSVSNRVGHGIDTGIIFLAGENYPSKFEKADQLEDCLIDHICFGRTDLRKALVKFEENHGSIDFYANITSKIILLNECTDFLDAMDSQGREKRIKLDMEEDNSSSSSSSGEEEHSSDKSSSKSVGGKNLDNLVHVSIDEFEFYPIPGQQRSERRNHEPNAEGNQALDPILEDADVQLAIEAIEKETAENKNAGFVSAEFEGLLEPVFCCSSDQEPTTNIIVFEEKRLQELVSELFQDVELGMKPEDLPVLSESDLEENL